MTGDSIFRTKTTERISSPEQLSDYLRVNNSGVWLILAAVLLILAGLFAWSAVGTLETRVPARVAVNQGEAKVVLLTNQEGLIKTGMPLRAAGHETVISDVEKDEYGRDVAHAELSLPDGSYEGVVVTETVHPISFLLRGR